MSRKKSDIKRPYAPDYISRASLAYRLDVSESRIDQLVATGVLPPPIEIDGQKRWRWEDVDATLAGDPSMPVTGRDDDNDPHHRIPAMPTRRHVT